MNNLHKYISSLNSETKWHGNHNENPRDLFLKAGHLSMLYENGNIRYISAGNIEVIRMIYPALRDKDWRTVLPMISEEEFDLKTCSFRIRYHSRYRSDEIDFSAYFTIDGNPDNSLTFSFEGEAMNTFAKNRIGFCVLHPIENCAGKTCIITHTTGKTETAEFPDYISPHQPFYDIQSMKWNVDDLNLTIDFRGDVFETEDQRNWTDASFKTYCTPLNRPFPAIVQKGEKINQVLRFKAEGIFPEENSKSNNIIITTKSDITFKIPEIGICRSTRPEPLTEGEAGIIRKLRFDHYRVDLLLFTPDWRINAATAVSEAKTLEYPLEFALFFDDNAPDQSVEFIYWVSLINTEIAQIIIYHKNHPSTPDMLTDTVIPLLKKALPGIKTGCGTNANFAQLNRNRPESKLNDFISYSVHPQEHASDNITLTENLIGQKYTVESAIRFAKGKDIRISPVNIQRRFNANKSNYENQLPVTGFPFQVDSRLMSLFGAAWSTGSLKYLSEAGIKGVTYFETAGERGIIQGDLPSRWPGIFPSFKGMLFPVYFIFDYLLKHKSYKLVKCISSDPLKVDSLILSRDEEIRIIIVNYTLYNQKILFPGYKGTYNLRELNAASFSTAVCNEKWPEIAVVSKINLEDVLVLEPYSVSFIDKEH